MRALLGFVIALTGRSCLPSEPEPQPPAVSTVEVDVAPRAAAPTVSAEPVLSSAASESASDELPKAGPCALPSTRPPDFRARIVQRTLPIHGAPGSTGWEVHAAGAPCPIDPAVPAPCKVLTPSELDRLYKVFLAQDFCHLRHPTPSVASSPHYGHRAITVFIGGRAMDVSDSSTARLDEGSTKRFDSIYAAVVEAANKTP